jgi:hypothetical protein
VINDANTRAERDLYRDTLLNIAEWLAIIEADSQHTPDKDVSRMKAATLVSILPVDDFDLPVTRTHLSADNKSSPTTPKLGAWRNPRDSVWYMRQEIAGAIAKLRNRPFIIQGSAKLEGRAAVTATNTVR